LRKATEALGDSAPQEPSMNEEEYKKSRSLIGTKLSSASAIRFCLGEITLQNYQVDAIPQDIMTAVTESTNEGIRKIAENAARLLAPWKIPS
jgi:hypothetical protein